MEVGNIEREHKYVVQDQSKILDKRIEQERKRNYRGVSCSHRTNPVDSAPATVHPADS